MYDIVCPRYPSGFLPLLTAGRRNFLCAFPHDVKGWSQEYQLFYMSIFLAEQPCQPATQGGADKGQRGTVGQHLRHASRIIKPIIQRIVGEDAFRVTISTKIKAAKPPVALTTQIGKGLAFVAPPLGKKPGNKEQLPVLTGNAVPDNAFGIASG